MRWLTVGLAVATFLPLLVRAWWLRRRSVKANREADWALAIAWTPVLNLYLGIYDVTLIVVSALLLAAWQLQKGNLQLEAKIIFLLLYVTPWLTQPVAQATGLQLLTVVLTAFGLYVLWWEQAAEKGRVITPWRMKPAVEAA